MAQTAEQISDEKAAQDAGVAAVAPQSRRSSVAPLRRDDFDRDVWCVLGLPIDISNVDQTADAVRAAARDGGKLSFVTPNVNWLIRALRDSEARRQVLDADLCVADGAPLALMARMLGAPVGERTAGSDIFDVLRSRPGFQNRRLKVFFFGGRDGAAEAAAAALNEDKRGMEAVGWHNPGFGNVEDMSDDATIAKINAQAPDFIVVALGAAKGQAWIDHNKDRLNAASIAHLGAVIDFAAGGIERAPALFRKTGFEWLWRIKEENSLWRRYFDDAVALSSIVATRLIPQLLPARRTDDKSPVSVELRDIAGEVTLAGSLTGSREVRQAFRRLAAGRGDIVIDLAGAKSMDRSFLGLLLLLEKHAVRRGASIFLRNTGRAHKRLLAANAMNYADVAPDIISSSPIASPKRAAI